MESGRRARTRGYHPGRTGSYCDWLCGIEIRGRTGKQRLSVPLQGAIDTQFICQILANAAERGVESLCLRMGQACGPEDTGAWGTTEWIPIMVKSSVALGVLPEMNGVRNTSAHYHCIR